MLISALNDLNKPAYKQSFGALSCYNEKARFMLSRTISKQNFNQLVKLVNEQRENPVNISLYSKNGHLLRANISCVYRLKDFKEHYMQIPIIESNFSFIKRVVRKANEYKEQLLEQAKLFPEAFPNIGIFKNSK